MSLISFHRVLIVTAIAFCVGFSAWEMRLYLSDGGSAHDLLLALLFLGLGLVLTVYLARLKSFLRPR